MPAENLGMPIEALRENKSLRGVWRSSLWIFSLMNPAEIDFIDAVPTLHQIESGGDRARVGYILRGTMKE